MITTEKLIIYEKYEGNSDLLEYTATDSERNQFSDNGWMEIEGLIQDVNLIKKGLVSKDYENRVNEKINNLCDSVNTIELLHEIAYAK